jgi:hypothetical protein
MRRQSVVPKGKAREQKPKRAFDLKYALNEANFDFAGLETHEHKWLQRGRMLICQVPGKEHGHFIEHGYNLQQSANGALILVKDD